MGIVVKRKPNSKPRKKGNRPQKTAWKQHTSTWSIEGVRTVGITLILQPTQEQYRQLYALRAAYYKGARLVRKVIHGIYKENNTFRYFDDYDSKERTFNTTALRDYVKPQVENQLIALGFVYSDQRECIIEYVANRYIGYIKRHDKKLAGPIGLAKNSHGHNYGSMNYGRGVKVDIANSQVIIRSNIVGEVIKIPFVVPKYFRPMLKYIKKDIRTIISKIGAKNPIIKVKVDTVPITWLYQPETICGIDINMGEDFVVVYYADGTTYTIKRTPDLEEAIKKLKALNKDKKDSKSKETKVVIERQIKTVRKLIAVLVKPLMLNLIEEVKNKKALLCIDFAKTGKTNGDYGQTAVIDVLTEVCSLLPKDGDQRYGIPFVHVPPAYTTQRCYKCGRLTKISLKTKVYTCDNESCDYTENRDVHGAKNTMLKGELIWEYGYKQGIKLWDEQYIVKGTAF